MVYRLRKARKSHLPWHRGSSVPAVDERYESTSASIGVPGPDHRELGGPATVGASGRSRPGAAAGGRGH